MTSFVNLSGATGPDAPFTETVATALDRNLFAAFEGDPTAIAAGVQFQTAAIADKSVVPRVLGESADDLSSSELFDFLRVTLRRTASNNSEDEISPPKFIGKSGYYRIRMSIVVLATSNRNYTATLKSVLLVNGVEVVSTNPTPTGYNPASQVSDTLQYFQAGDSIVVKNKWVSGSQTFNTTYYSSIQVYTEELFNESQRQFGWAYDENGLDGPEYYLVSLRT
tara:strand:+ start:6717 stop:7385 length:669 start_codon:yes stop_codon:yes gene_type:complete